MYHLHSASKLIAAHAGRDGRSRFEGCSNQWRMAAAQSGGDDAGSNRGSTTVANAALSGTSSTYAEDMYKLWLKDRRAVHASWDRYFTAGEGGAPAATSAALNKDRLVQYLPARSSSQAESLSQGSADTRRVTIAGDDNRPIVIKIEVVADDDASIASSVQSDGNITLKSGHSTGPQPNWQGKTVVPPGVQLPPSTPTHTLVAGKRIGESERVASSQSDWKSRAAEFDRLYHHPTREHRTRMPVFRTASKTIAPPVTPPSAPVPGHHRPNTHGRFGAPITIEVPPVDEEVLSGKASDKMRNLKTFPGTSKQATVGDPPAVVGSSSSQNINKSAATGSLVNRSVPLKTTSAKVGPIRSEQPAKTPSIEHQQVKNTSVNTVQPVNRVTATTTSKVWPDPAQSNTQNQSTPKTTSASTNFAPRPPSDAASSPPATTTPSRWPNTVQTSRSTTIPSQSASSPITRTSSQISSGSEAPSGMNAAAAPGGGGGATNDLAIREHIAVHGVIRSYQNRGHREAWLDPLGILDRGKQTLEQRKGLPSAVIYRQHTDVTKIDLDKEFLLPKTTFIGQGKASLPLREVVKRLEHAYAHHIGAEFMYIHEHSRTLWLRKQLETPMSLDKARKIKLLKRLVRSVHFENFLAKKYTSEKRFGSEGCDAIIPCVKQIIDTGTDMGVDAVNICMAHRGRLNVLANVCNKSLKDIFTTFEGLGSPDEGSGDVKYHLGTVMNLENDSNKKKVRVCVVANPSHLEVVCPVCLGKTRAEQFMRGDAKGQSIMGLYIHGDAAFCGQGVVYECMHFSHLPNYTTHGTIHIVINNQVAFTTDPRFSRSSPYCTDVGRVVLAPIFHVNADDAEAVAHVSRIAAEWRQTFLEDVVIDLVGYRRNGHNELDEPMFTQPLMYQIIRKHPNALKIYGDQLIKEGVVQQADIDDYVKQYVDLCEQDFAKAKNEKEIRFRDWLDSPWKKFFKKGAQFTAMPDTGVSEDVLQHIGKAFASPPPGGFVIHRGLERILKNRAKMIEARTTDWALGEALAYGTLMKEGYHVRLSGQDVERGTFAHRHHIMHHQTEDRKTFNVLANLYSNQAPYMVCNSALSEYATLGFELGYAQVSPYALVLWEAQFGDFCNTAQTVIDTFLSAGQSKWYRQCGLVMLLPHGMEGMGPEHSSARLERFLQLCDDDPRTQGPFDEKFNLHEHEHCNWFVASCTTPASVFHLLRRQLLLPFRKPLILMSPKSFLRHPLATSSFDEYLPGTQFRRLIPDAGPASKAPDQVKKLIFCAGRTYYDLLAWTAEAKKEGQIAIARTEQMSPFPYDLVAAEIRKYKNARVVWAQEEHRNQGAWVYMHERIDCVVDGKRKCEYNGRLGASAAATGNKQQYLSQVADYKAQILNV